MAMETVTDEAARSSPARWTSDADELGAAKRMSGSLPEEAPTSHLVSARRLGPFVSELRDRFGAERELPARLVERLRPAGVFRMWLPRCLGGAELVPMIEAVDLAHQSAGGAALRYGSRLERCFRDVHTAGQHAMLSRHANLEVAGRVLFGLPPATARL